MSKFRMTAGSVVAIPLDIGGFGYGQAITNVTMAFFRCWSPEILSAQEVVSQPVLFRLWIDPEAVRDGSWPKIGRAALSDDLLQSQPTFIWSEFQKQPFILADEGRMTPATIEECEGLERALMWGSGMVRCRLQDTLSGKQDRWIQIIEPNIEL